MINKALKESVRLAGRSKNECIIFVMGMVLCVTVDFALRSWLGVNINASNIEILKTSQLKYLAIMAPVMIIQAWFMAGLAGRISMDALSGELVSMWEYSNQWFFPMLAGEFMLAVLFIAPTSLMSFGEKTRFAEIFIIIGLLFYFVSIWFTYRACLWRNIMFFDRTGPIEAIKRSYEAARGYYPLLVVFFLPLPFVFVQELIGKKLLEPGTFAYQAIAGVMSGLITIITIGAKAFLYLEKNKIAASEVTETSKSGVGA